MYIPKDFLLQCQLWDLPTLGSLILFGYMTSSFPTLEASPTCVHVLGTVLVRFGAKLQALYPCKSPHTHLELRQVPDQGLVTTTGPKEADQGHSEAGAWKDMDGRKLSCAGRGPWGKLGVFSSSSR